MGSEMCIRDRSRKWGAIVVILLGLAATVASFLPPGEWSPVLGTIARHG